MKCLIDNPPMSYWSESGQYIKNIYLFQRNIFPFRPGSSTKCEKFQSQVINMLPMLENMSYCWLLMSIYIHDLMEIHRHMLVFIYSVTKKFMFLGLTRVYFYHPYTCPGRYILDWLRAKRVGSWWVCPRSWYLPGGIGGMGNLYEW